ncbi:serine protease [Ideonella sp. DXS29W]|uniref:Serine protease n=1 Tax=Ideonella lacteola TaxID=2984193 RepID=A0ABU9BLB8_9BURK
MKPTHLKNALGRRAGRSVGRTALGAAMLGSAGLLPVLAQAGTMREQVEAYQAQLSARHGGPVQDAQPEVVGGKPAKDGRWPFMASLMEKRIADNFDSRFCGASLISKRDILTAAHCITLTGATAKNTQVLVGTQDLTQGGRRINIASITVHPDWNEDTTDSDVAVIRLTEEVNDIEPVAFATTLKEENKHAATGKPTWGMGWGSTQSNPPYPEKLLNVRLPIVDREVCNSSDSYDGAITNTMLCAGFKEGGKDTCGGDSGGPLVAKDSSGEFRLQVGVVSWGIGCAQPDLYGVYSRLAVLGPWVKDQVAKP